MKSRDQIERELAQCILSACQVSQDSGKGFYVPLGTLPDLLPPQRLTAADARHAVGIGDVVWDQEFRRHLMVAQIMEGRSNNGGSRKAHRRPG
jgi:hypothetical protein